MSEIWSKMCTIFHVKYPLFLSAFNENYIFSTDFRKYTNIKFHEIPPSWIRCIACGRIDEQTDRETERQRGRETATTKPTVPFRNFANTPNRVFYIFSRNTSERNRCITCEYSSRFERCCSKKNNRRSVTVNTASPLTWPVSKTKNRYKDRLGPETILKLQLSPLIPDFKLM
jgi:hypothetical protein